MAKYYEDKETIAGLREENLINFVLLKNQTFVQSTIDWYAIDIEGNIGVINSDTEGFIPSEFFSIEIGGYQQLFDYFFEIDSEFASLSPTQSLSGLMQTGFYYYRSDELKGYAVAEREIIPTTPVNVHHLPITIKGLMRTLYKGSFREATSINITESWEECSAPVRFAEYEELISAAKNVSLFFND